ncbi:uncharacterized protein (TIGR00299 family) protein [Methanomicrobium sp. W14]|uniref:nickel pincer cofactor biosynthesis protein LarC n=1 Tax=Methanomicrobium sp. W14 TaxID=2817839 RepID=UPI001AE6DC1E|nr:nickel pincer cofactor biosynthesis protein LarC [Methanomicrobium sp. W14]MBP2132662.1 uncharacterized protein (TIGR00299 family) protein [Methanomicrobium sp. W14]
MKTLLIDPKAGGIAGDMLTASLADLTGCTESIEKVAEAVSTLEGCSNFDARLVTAKKGFNAKQLSVKISENRSKPSVNLENELCGLLDYLEMSSYASEKAASVLSDLNTVYSRFHGKNSNNKNFFSADTIFDIICPILILEDSGLLQCPIYSTPPALGSGVIQTENGIIGGPAPAALEICAMHRIPVAENSSDMELTTPTGAALLANLAVVREEFPQYTPVKTGYGAGTKESKNGYNIIRVIEGEISDLTDERIVILETNLDDVTGEVMGYTIERLLNAGAVDVFVTQGFGKKNRPVFIMSVITGQDKYMEITRILMKETGTLGVRIREEPRIVAERKREVYNFRIKGNIYPVRVKISKHKGKTFTAKPEFEDMKKIAQKLQVSLREVALEVNRQMKSVTGEKLRSETDSIKSRE